MAEHAVYNQVRADVINRLKSNVQQRIATSDDFSKELQRIERYKEQKARDYVSLNEEEFFARRKELSAEKEDEERLKEIEDNDEMVMDLEDFYDREIMNITLDYVGMLSNVSAVASGR
jgi:carboxyl-terminal processing protease